jgi:peptidoglycan/LPS O-acetylase OafA/YrhL
VERRNPFFRQNTAVETPATASRPARSPQFGSERGDVASPTSAQAIAKPARLSEVLAGSRLPALDGLRAVAIGVVMAYHGGLAVPGDLGVTCFFVLSGFLITWLLLKEHAKHGRISLRDFYWRRVLRIIPAYAAYVVVTALYTRWRTGEGWDPWLTLSALTYTTNYYNAAHGHAPTPISHTWSLAVEEQFYMLWPLALLALMRLPRPRALQTLIGVIAAVLVWRSFAYYVLGTGTAYVYNCFETRFDCLAVGCLLALATQQSNFDAVAQRLVRFDWLPLVTVGLIVVSRTCSEAYHYGPGFTVDSLLFGVLIVQLMLLARKPVWSWLETPAVRWVGLLSYSLYLYHGLGLGFGRKLGSLPLGAQLGLGIVASFALALASYHGIEKPFLRLKKRFERR